MAPPVKDIKDAFHLLYCNLHDREFRKTLEFREWTEQEMLPLVRTFLLGRFGKVAPEIRVKLPGSATGYGRVDFLIGDVAVEFAMRKPFDPKGPLSSKVNATEIKKLMLHNGPSLLVLFDFAKSHFQYEDLKGFRNWPSLGRGNHKRHAFNVSYHYQFLTSGRKMTFDCHSLNVRV